MSLPMYQPHYIFYLLQVVIIINDIDLIQFVYIELAGHLSSALESLQHSLKTFCQIAHRARRYINALFRMNTLLPERDGWMKKSLHMRFCKPHSSSRLTSRINVNTSLKMHSSEKSA